MIIALPCISFSVKEREIILKHGFLPFPQFLDNHYVRKKKSDVIWLIKNIEKYKDLVKFAIAPDYKYKEAVILLKKYPFVNWIFPLHKKNELEFALNFDWIGFPHRKAFRDYDIEWYFENTKGKKHWYLGFWNESSPHIIKRFDGLDTTLPETYSGKYGKLWFGWKNYKKGNIKTRIMFEHNVTMFKKSIENLTQTLLDEMLESARVKE
jgi:hypothetical protein